MNTAIETILKEVEKNGCLHDSTVKEATARQEVLAKPTGALGTLEEISIKLAGITGEVKNDVTRQAVVIMSADNGVVEEGVASAPQSVTLSQTINFTRHFTGVSALAQYFGIDLLVCDMGVKMNSGCLLHGQNGIYLRCGKSTRQIRRQDCQPLTRTRNRKPCKRSCHEHGTMRRGIPHRG